MPVADSHCVTLILVAYLAYGVLGIALEYAAAKQVRDEVSGAKVGGNMNFDRLDRFWTRGRIPVLLGLIVAGWFLCQ